MRVSKSLASLIAIAIGSALPLLASAEAPVVVAKLTKIEGNVMVNQGVNYGAAKPGMELKTGAKVVTTKNSSVAIVYNNGCIKQVKPNSILSVGPAAECTNNQIKERAYVAEAVGETATDAPPPAAGSFGVVGGLGWVAPASFGLVAAAGIAGSNNDNNDRNASAE